MHFYFESRQPDMAAKSAPTEPAAPPVPADGPRPSTVQWNDKNMATHFANVVNVQSTREQVDLFFGTNQTWNIADGPVVASPHQPLILTPFAAKRLLASQRRAARARAAPRAATSLTRLIKRPMR